MIRRKAAHRRDVETLRSGSERLSALNQRFSASLDRLVGATVRLGKQNRRLEAAERSLKERGSAFVAAAFRTSGGRRVCPETRPWRGGR